MLQKSNIFLIASMIAIALLFVGAGCNDPEPEIIPEETEEQKVVVKKPPGTDTMDYAIESCETQGFAPVLKYDKQSKTTITFCEFGDGYACNALAYLMGACTTTSTNRIYIAAEENAPDNLRTCSEEEEPVCGKDGITYVNSCIAALQSAIITHTGVCTEEEIKLATKDTSSNNGNSSSGNTSSGSSNSGSSSGSSKTPPSGTPTWTKHLLSIAGNKINRTGAPVTKSCTYGSTRVFYMVENCPNCFSTLYSNTGKVLCHPHNNLRGECPDYFDKDNTAAHCKTI